MNKTSRYVSRVALACLTTILFFTANAKATYVENPMTADLQGAGYTVQGVGTLVATNIGAAALNTLSLITCDPWVDARAYGTNYSSGTISAALTAIGSSEATLLLAPGTWSISGSITIPANINLKPMRGAVLAIASGQTLTIEGTIEAGSCQIFDDADADGDGVVFDGFVAASAPVTWWGASPSASAAANNIAFQQVMNCLNGTGIPLHVPAGTYQLSATLNHKWVDINGDSMSYTVLNNSADRCMQADPVNPSSANYVRNITLRGVKFGYHTNGKQQVRNLFDRVYFDGGLADNGTPPTRGYGVYCDDSWIECRLVQCVINQIGWFNGPVLNINTLELCRINDVTNTVSGGHVLYIGEGGAGAKSMFMVRDCTINRGSIKVDRGSGNLGHVSIENTSIINAIAAGTDGLVVGNCNSIRLSNIMAENYAVKYTGTVSMSFIQDISCYTFDWNRQPNVFAWGITAQSPWARTDSVANDSSVMECQGTLYGRAFMKRSVSVRFPADTSATQTWTRALHTTTRSSWISAVRMVAEENVPGTNTNYATLKFQIRGGYDAGYYDLTTGNDMTAFVPKAIPMNVYGYAYNLADEAILIQKTVTGTGRQLPAMTFTVEYYDQGQL